MPGSAEAYAFLDLALAGLAGHAPRVNRIVWTRAWPPSEDLEVRAATGLDDPLDGVVEWWPEDGDPRVPVQVIVLDRPWLRPLLERPGVLASLPPASVKRWARWRPGEPEPD